MVLTHFLFQLIFQATVRCLTCTEIAGDPKVVARYRQHFNQAEQLSPAVVLFPWLPGPTMVMRTWATKKMYDIIAKAIKVRKESGIPQNDTLQMLLDSGEEHFTIVGVRILLLKLPHYSRQYVSLVYDGFRIGWGASDWYRRRVRRLMPRSYRNKLTLYQLPGWSHTLAVIRSGATKYAQKSRN
jgi:hypothetical protein